MKTTVDLPDDLLIRAKKRAAELRRPLRALIADGLRAQLARPGKSRRKRKKFHLVTVAGGAIPGLDLSNREKMYEWFDRHG
ncbi:MAG: antitoxin [Candidatus Binataceae bacterium]